MQVPYNQHLILHIVEQQELRYTGTYIVTIIFFTGSEEFLSYSRMQLFRSSRS